MKKNVYTDGNGSSLVLIQGMGEYVPYHELVEAQNQLKQLQDMGRALSNASFRFADKNAAFPERQSFCDALDELNHNTSLNEEAWGRLQKCLEEPPAANDELKALMAGELGGQHG